MKTKFKFFIAFFLAVLNTLASDFTKYRELVDKRMSQLSKQCSISVPMTQPPFWFSKLSDSEQYCIRGNVQGYSRSVWSLGPASVECDVKRIKNDQLESLKKYYREEHLDWIKGRSIYNLKDVLNIEKEVQSLEQECLEQYGSILYENEVESAQSQLVDYYRNLIDRMQISKLRFDKSDEMIQQLESERKNLEEDNFGPSANYMTRKLNLGKWNGGKFFMRKHSIKKVGDQFREHLRKKIDRQEEEDYNNKKK
jgi:hypothetical protein